MRCAFAIVVWAAAAVAAAAADRLEPGLVNERVERTLDVSTQIVKSTAKITLKNGGASAVRAFHVAVEPEAVGTLAFAAAKDASKRDLKVAEASVDGRADGFVRVELKEPLEPAASAAFVVELAFTRRLAPHPAAISQKDRQLVRYEGNHYFYSPYATDTQRTVVALGTKNVESHSKLKPTSLVDSTVAYGPYENVAPFSRDELAVHFENNSPFLTVTRLERTIEVSHWGNVAVEETIDVYHSGAKLDGPFSRYDYQQDSTSGPSSVKSYKTLLPASATGVYYRDTNGNISTSHMKIKKDAVELDLRPRFPLFGGWKTHYTLGYDVPSYEYLFHSGERYLLKMRVVDHVFDDMVVDEVTTKIVLPEGSSDVKLTTPYAVTRHPDSKRYTYLDTNGRPTISFTKRNVVENHIQDFQLRYTFPRLLMLQEPILVVIFLYVLFLCVIFYVRLDFSLQKPENLKE